MLLAENKLNQISCLPTHVSLAPKGLMPFFCQKTLKTAISVAKN